MRLVGTTYRRNRRNTKKLTRAFKNSNIPSFSSRDVAIEKTSLDASATNRPI
jgi:hypothetical protein